MEAFWTALFLIALVAGAAWSIGKVAGCQSEELYRQDMKKCYEKYKDVNVCRELNARSK